MILLSTVDFAIRPAPFLLWQTQKGIRDIIPTSLELQGELNGG